MVVLKKIPSFIPKGIHRKRLKDQDDYQNKPCISSPNDGEEPCTSASISSPNDGEEPCISASITSPNKRH